MADPPRGDSPEPARLNFDSEQFLPRGALRQRQWTNRRGLRLRWIRTRQRRHAALWPVAIATASRKLSNMPPGRAMPYSNIAS